MARKKDANATAKPRKSVAQRTAESVAKARKNVGKFTAKLIAGQISATGNPSAGAELSAAWQKFDAALEAVSVAAAGDSSQIEAPIQG